ncbi:MAG: phosphoglycerate kinase [Candidatus Aenigmarchaeota archaeon]|nr:phosphoglycerate kinase [Candidatus Aenigmarchaeota archaeon]
MMEFDSVRLLRDAEIREGQRWIYSADFNTRYATDAEGKVRPKNPARIDDELNDMRFILDRGGTVAILAHQGRHGKAENPPIELRGAAAYLSEKLGMQVCYCETNTGRTARDYVREMRPGQIAVMGNTRMHEGEEKNHLPLANEYTWLGRFAAIGGFGKAHRANASNVGILEYIPGFLAESQRREMELLAPWAGSDGSYSVAILGGVKKEKITIGLRRLVETYDCIIPGGIVLNTILKVRGIRVGDSVLEDDGRTFEREMGEVLEGPHAHKIWMPAYVAVARKEGDEYKPFGNAHRDSGVENGYIVADLVTGDSWKHLQRSAREGGRVLMAGTPGLFLDSTREMLGHVNGARVLILGGDTVSDVGEVDERITRSTGGGSALYFIAEGTTPVFEALKRNFILSR